jgi:hypothetical protein
MMDQKDWQKDKDEGTSNGADGSGISRTTGSSTAPTSGSSSGGTSGGDYGSHTTGATANGGSDDAPGSRSSS